MTLRLALLGDVEGEIVSALASAGLSVAGALAADPFALVPRSPEHPPPRHYAGLAEVVEAARARALDAAVLPPGSPLAAELPTLLEAGLPLLLPEPAPWEPDLLRQARAAGDVPVAVLLRERDSRWVRLASEGLDAARGTGAGEVVQVTVRGWPRGAVAAAELVDLVRAWCGDVVAVSAAPAPLPAAVLPDGPRVVWALLTAGGATVLVAHEGPEPSVRLSLPGARLLVGPGQVGWEGGPVLRLGTADAARAGAGGGTGAGGVGGPSRAPVDPVRRTCAAFAAAVRDGADDRLGATPGAWPWVADLADLLPTARVLAALREAARGERWVELG